MDHKDGNDQELLRDSSEIAQQAKSILAAPEASESNPNTNKTADKSAECPQENVTPGISEQKPDAAQEAPYKSGAAETSADPVAAAAVDKGDEPTEADKLADPQEAERLRARQLVRERALQRERNRQKAVQKKNSQRRSHWKSIVLAALILACVTVSVFSLSANWLRTQGKPAEYTLASLDTVIDAVSVNGQIVPTEISNEGMELIDYESEINQFLPNDNGFILYDAPQVESGISGVSEIATQTDLPLPEEVEPTPLPTPTPAPVSGYAVISVDGAIVASLNSGEDAQWLTDKLTDAYSNPTTDGKIVSRGFVENVEILSQDEKPQNLMAREEVYLLLKDRLNVRLEVEQSLEEAIKYGTKYVDDSSMNQGLMKTVTEGKNGKQQSVYSIVSVNGKQQSKKLLAKKVLIDPVSAVVSVGTKAVYSSNGVSLPAGSYAPGQVPLGANYPNIDKTLSKPGPNQGIMGPSAGSLKFITPAPGNISSYFGWRWGRMHYGLDYPNPTGTPVKASEGGTVTSYTGTHTGYGYIVEISHGGGFTTRYAHLNQILVTVGQHVNQGDVIGTVGTSGTTTSGPHLHFEIRNTGTPYNPLFYLNR